MELHRIHLEARPAVLEQHKETKPNEFQQTQIELQIAREYTRRLNSRLNREENEIRALSRAQLESQDIHFRLNLDQEMYDAIKRRIRLLESQLQSIDAAR